MLESLRKKLSLQDWIPGADDTRKKNVSVNTLKAGDTITFGVLPQEFIAGKSFTLGAAVHYQFTATQLCSYPLLDETLTPCCTMIIARAGTAHPYLAISRKLNAPTARDICTEDDAEKIRHEAYPQHLYIRKHTAGLHDWLHLHYENRIKSAKGTKILRGQEVKSFAYSLYVAENQFKALEIERYPNGEYDLFATIFRPVSDIIAITPARHMADTLSTAIAMTADTAKATSSSVAGRSEPALASSRSHAAGHHTDIDNSAKIFTLPTALNIQGAAVMTTSELLPDTSAQHRHIACNLRMASKLIDEAMRNDMRVADVIRKAIGLKVAEDDLVRFDLKLSDKDYQSLAARFDVHVQNKDKIHELIMEELGHFTGEGMS